MCTAACFCEGDFYFGRTLDYESSYGEEIVISPRRLETRFTCGENCTEGYAVIGTAHVSDGYPLYYDAANECGLCMAGLNFVGNAGYGSFKKGARDVAQFELIPWILRQCGSVVEARKLLEETNVTARPFGKGFPAAELHWIIADKNGAITVEAQEGGIRIYDNPVGVLTNNPPFDMQITGLSDYSYLSPKQPENKFCKELEFSLYSRGMGAMGLPGDWSSRSRFVRAAFVRANSFGGDTENGRVSQMFHVLGSVNQVKGCCDVGGAFEYTIYTSCINADKGIYYYKTYDSQRLFAVDMKKADLDGNSIVRFPMKNEMEIEFQN